MILSSGQGRIFPAAVRKQRRRLWTAFDAPSRCFLGGRTHRFAMPPPPKIVRCGGNIRDPPVDKRYVTNVHSRLLSPSGAVGVAGWRLVRTHAVAAARALPTRAPPHPLGAALLSGGLRQMASCSALSTPQQPSSGHLSRDPLVSPVPTRPLYRITRDADGPARGDLEKIAAHTRVGGGLPRRHRTRRASR